MKHTSLFFSGIFLFLLLSSRPVKSQGSWQRVPLPTQQFLKSVCFTDSLCGWVAGDSGIIFHTVNGGADWVLQNTGTTYSIEDVFFLDCNRGWAAAANFITQPFGTVMLHTNDGGATWAHHPYPDHDVFIACILFRDPLNGWMGGRPHALVRTSDGGATWTQAAIDTSTLAFFPVLSIQFYDDRYGYASGGMFDIAGVTWHTSDGGNRWYAIDPSQAPADEVHGLHLFDSVRVMGAGGDPDFGYGVGMIRTSDGGWNWTYDELDIQGNAYDLDFRNDHEAWAPLGPRRLMIYSADTGQTWTAVAPPDNAALYDMTFPDPDHGWCAGKEGVLLKFIPPVVPAVPETRIPAGGYRLSPPRPNPATDQAVFGVTLPRENAAVRLEARDLAGCLLARVETGFLSPGNHEVVFDVSLLPAGTFFVFLQVRNGTSFRNSGIVQRITVAGRR